MGSAVIVPENIDQPRKGLFKMSMRKREAIFGYIFLSPWLIGFVVFLLGPMIASIFLSMTDYKMIRPPVWIGLANYERMFTDPLVLKFIEGHPHLYSLFRPAGLVAAMLWPFCSTSASLPQGFFGPFFTCLRSFPGWLSPWCLPGFSITALAS